MTIVKGEIEKQILQEINKIYAFTYTNGFKELNPDEMIKHKSEFQKEFGFTKEKVEEYFELYFSKDEQLQEIISKYKEFITDAEKYFQETYKKNSKKINEKNIKALVNWCLEENLERLTKVKRIFFFHYIISSYQDIPDEKGFISLKGV